MAARDLDHEVLALRRRIAALLKEAHANEKLLKNTHAREMELLKADDLPQLFNVICGHLSQSYRLESVSLLVLDRDHEIRHLLLGAQVRLEDHPNVMFLDEPGELQLIFGDERQPWLGPYAAHRHRKLFRYGSGINSVALIPLWQRGQWLGCICFGSYDEGRFAPNLATDFLAHLGVVASFAMDNAVNRARLVRSGITDFLTGWHNRRYLHERLKEELSIAHRANSTVACVLLDLDYFKTINDTYGHQVGDLALQAAADRINQQIRGGDAAARYGGDEFVVLARNLNREQVALLAERMRQSVCLEPLHLPDNSQHNMSVSVGVALMQMGGARIDMKSAAEQLLAEADAALYRAKQAGRNRVEITVC
jgi:two-component system, cell cycle response regulator